MTVRNGGHHADEAEVADWAVLESAGNPAANIGG